MIDFMYQLGCGNHLFGQRSVSKLGRAVTYSHNPSTGEEAGESEVSGHPQLH